MRAQKRIVRTAGLALTIILSCGAAGRAEDHWEGNGDHPHGHAYGHWKHRDHVVVVPQPYGVVVGEPYVVGRPVYVAPHPPPPPVYVAPYAVPGLSVGINVPLR